VVPGLDVKTFPVTIPALKKSQDKKMKMKALLGAVLAGSLLLSGCGMVDNAVRTDESIKEKAAFALGTTADKVIITQRTSDIDSVRFHASTQGKVFQCYYSTAGISSDAICSPTDGSSLPTAAGSASCNALLKAAHKC